MYSTILKCYILLISGALEWVCWAGDAFWEHILLTRLSWTENPDTDRVAVQLLFFPFTTTSPHIDSHLAHKKCSYWVKMVCFIYFLTFHVVLGLFNASGGSKSPGLHVPLLPHLCKPSNKAVPHDNISDDNPGDHHTRRHRLPPPTPARGHKPSPDSQSCHPSTLHNDIRANHRHTQIPHKEIVCNTSGDRISASISVLEAPQSAQPTMRMATSSTTRMTTREMGGFILQSVALVLSWGVLNQKEVKDRGSRRVRDIEQDGGMKIRTLMPNNSDDKHAPLSIKGRPRGSTNVLVIKVIQCFTCPLLPTMLNTNIGILCSTHTPQPPQSHASPLI